MGISWGTWDGKRSHLSTTWLRWWDSAGNLLLWGSELIEQTRQRVDEERQKAEQERQRAEEAEARLQQEQVVRQRVLDRLKMLGVEADWEER